MAHAGVTINAILPGAFDTDRLASGTKRMAEIRGVDPTVVTQERIASIPARRLGQADEFGELCAFLASRQAGYITGQSILIDGGAFRTVL